MGGTMMRVLALISFILFTSACAKSDNGGPSELEQKAASGCKTMTFTTSQHVLRYCVRSTGPVKSLIYYFHGAGGDASDIYAGQFDELYQSLAAHFGANVPGVVSVSFGQVETMPIETQSADPVSVDELVNVAMPIVENELGFDSQHVPVRNLMGLSLGGFNALNLAGERETSFKSVSALCPALIDFDPFDAKQVQGYITRNQSVVNPDLVNQTIQLLQSKYTKDSIWNNNDPLNKIESGKLASLPIFISTGSEDDYGFFEGANAFVRLAQPLNKQLVWAPTTGKHCSFDNAALASFLDKYVPQK